MRQFVVALHYGDPHGSSVVVANCGDRNHRVSLGLAPDGEIGDVTLSAFRPLLHENRG
jgi:hypothetical protein